ncbi:hypothetical protein X797_011812 [Metarhizium robertsii]|uniref:Extracellular serine-rich protein n=3 Tax=Metarhizium TaxID=5529 RepID=E9EJU0_METRA
MRFPTNLLGLAALTAVAVHPCLGQHGSILKVEVGADDNLRYNPASLEAPVGTKIEFHFFPKNHSVIESSFDNPCHPLSSDGFSSGFIPVTESPSNTTFTIIIKDTDPIWFYCAQANHCERGMVGAINAPKTGKTFQAFLDLAQKASDSTSPPSEAAGGTLGYINDGSASPGWDQTAEPLVTAPTNEVFTTAPAPTRTTRAYTTNEYKVTWTSSGHKFTTIATTTQFTTAIFGVSPTLTGEVGTSTSEAVAAFATGVPAYQFWQTGMCILAVAAML